QRPRELGDVERLLRDLHRPGNPGAAFARRRRGPLTELRRHRDSARRIRKHSSPQALRTKRERTMNYRAKNIGIAVALAAWAAVLTSVYVVNYKRHVQNG